MITIEKTDYQDLREFSVINCFGKLATNAQLASKELTGETPFKSTDYAVIRNGDVWAIALILYEEHGYTTISTEVIAFDENEIYGKFEIVKTFSFLA